VERLLVYLDVVAAVATVLYSVSRLKPQPDYCAEARRLASDVLAVYQSGGRVVGEYNLLSVTVNGSGVFCSDCCVSLREVPLDDTSANGTVFNGRLRLEITYSREKRVVSIYVVKS